MAPDDNTPTAKDEHAKDAPSTNDRDSKPRELSAREWLATLHVVTPEEFRQIEQEWRDHPECFIVTRSRILTPKLMGFGRKKDGDAASGRQPMHPDDSAPTAKDEHAGDAASGPGESDEELFAKKRQDHSDAAELRRLRQETRQLRQEMRDDEPERFIERRPSPRTIHPAAERVPLETTRHGRASPVMTTKRAERALVQQRAAADQDSECDHQRRARARAVAALGPRG